MQHSILRTTFFAAMVFASAATTSIAEETVINGQINLNDVISLVDVIIPDVKNNVKVKASAIGNNYVVQASNGGLTLNNTQESRTDNINSTVNIDVDQTKLVDVKSEAWANKLVVVSKGAGGNQITNNQSFGGAVGSGNDGEPISDVNMNVDMVGESKVDSQAGGNFAQFILAGTGNVVNTTQEFGAKRDSVIMVNPTETDNVAVKSEGFGNSMILVLGDVPAVE